MNDYGSNSNETGSADLLGAILSDGLMAGLIGGIIGAILPLVGLFGRSSSMVSLGFFVGIFLYFGIGLLTGYLFYSRKIGHRWGAAVAAVLAGAVTGTMTGAVLGLGFAQCPYFGVQNVSWTTWSCFSGLGAAFVAPLTAWIPIFFIKFDTGTGRRSSAPATESFFERRMKTRFVVGMISILIFVVIFVCRTLVQ